MNRSFYPTAQAAQQPGYQVELPRVSDAVGHALSEVYRRDSMLPQDMLLLLQRLNCCGARH